jgi:hypothetical protein
VKDRVVEAVFYRFYTRSRRSENFARHLVACGQQPYRQELLRAIVLLPGSCDPCCRRWRLVDLDRSSRSFYLGRRVMSVSNIDFSARMAARFS